MVHEHSEQAHDPVLEPMASNMYYSTELKRYGGDMDAIW